MITDVSFHPFVILTSVSLFLCLQVKNWVKELRKMLGNEICLCIVGKLSDNMNPISMFTDSALFNEGFLHFNKTFIV